MRTSKCGIWMRAKRSDAKEHRTTSYMCIRLGWFQSVKGAWERCMKPYQRAGIL